MAGNSSISSFNKLKLPYGICWMLLFFTILEGSTRILWDPLIIGQRLYTRFDYTYNYGFDANRKLWYKNGGKIVFYPTQYLNFHHQSLLQQKKENEFRIFTFGGSISKGDPENNYSYYLQRILKTKHSENLWTVVNLSADGIGSKRIRLLLEPAIQLQPDLFIIHVHGSNEYEDERDYSYRNELYSGTNGIFLKSYFFVLTKKIFSHLTSFDDSLSSNVENEIEASKDPIKLNRWNGIIDDNIKKIATLSKNHQIPVILVGRAEKNDSTNGFSSSRCIQINTIQKRHTNNAITFFDTASVLSNASDQNYDKNLIFSDNTHLTAYGHQLVAEQLYSHLFKFVLHD